MSDKQTYHQLPADPCLTEEQLLAYLDDQLRPEQRHAAEMHMLDCGLCSDALDGMALVKDRRKIAAFVPPVPAENTEERKPKIIFLQQRFWMAAAASVALLLGTVWILNRGTEISGDQSTVAAAVSKNQQKPQAVAPAEKADPNASGSSSPSLVLADTIRIFPKTESADAPQGGTDNDIASNNTNASWGESNRALTESQVPAESEKATKSDLGDRKDEYKKTVDAKTPTDALSGKASAPVATNERTETIASSSSQKTKSYRSKKARSAYAYSSPSHAEKEIAKKYDVQEKDKAGNEEPAKILSAQDSVVAVASSPSAGNIAATGMSNDADLFNTTSSNQSAYQSGMSYMQQKKYDAAISEFDKVIAVKNDPHYEDARWQKAMSLLASGKKPEAKTLLLDIEKTGGKYKSQASEQLKGL